MKRMTILVVVAMVATLAGCGTTAKETRLSNGVLMIQEERTMPFGTDHSSVTFFPPEAPAPAASAPMSVTPAPMPEKITLEKTYTKSVTIWTGCPDKTPNRNAKNIKREESTETWTEEKVLPQQQSPVMAATPTFQPVILGWGNASAGNLTAPAVAIGGGMIGMSAARRPNSYNSTINQSGGGAEANGGDAASASAAAAESRSNAEQWQDQDMRNSTDMDVDIDN